MKSQIGVIGLGTMGKALATNLLTKGFRVSGFNRTYSVTQKMTEEQQDKEFYSFEKIEDFINSLEIPRKIILMVPAGEATDMMIQKLLPLVDRNDIIMDCGNSFYKDTVIRYEKLKELGIYFYGIGVSGGEKGALLGPSIMPSGDKEIYEQISPFLEKIAAKKNEEPCCAYLGTDGAGHYVKMVHNGIEYADMQLIAEIYLIFKTCFKFTNQEIATIFQKWNNTEVGSYLVEITSKILVEKDLETANDLLDVIVDRASQKGTGKWTIMESSRLSQNVSMIQTAVESRITSGMTEERECFSQQICEEFVYSFNLELPSVDSIRKAYYLGKLVAYAQGFSLINYGSEKYQWNLDLSTIASIFRAGCIIQAELLDKLMKLYKEESDLKNFLMAPSMLEIVSRSIGELRYVNLIAIKNGVPIPSLVSALTYIDQLKSISLGSNLIQAQRDFFGAHTFERIDKKGSFHYEWEH